MNNNKWYAQVGEQNDIVVSTRIRLARNLAQYPFPAYLTPSEQKQVNTVIINAFKEIDTEKNLRFIDMEKVDQTAAVSMAEKRITSPEFSLNRAGKSLIVTNDDSVSIMLGEEDHIRLQVMRAGLDLETTFSIASGIDDKLSEKLTFAFSEELGYLTQCPTNLGTAMRASVLLHLPAIRQRGMMNRLASTVSKLGLTIRGAYGEGSDTKGDFYQLSNQVTLGISEENAIQNLKSITLQIINQERAARRELMENERFEDNVWRAYGILTNARILNSSEFMSLVSLVMIGASQELFPIEKNLINKLLFETQPATLATIEQNARYAAERDRLRARIVRSTLKKCAE
ncbi:MAG: protein arginine kinase [Clostridia bacterium]|nr:protein arginine kinase [Clostridia bacterium]